MTPVGRHIRSLTLALAIAFLVTSVAVGYWSLIAADSLARDPFNPRLVAAVRDHARGAIVDRGGRVLASSAAEGERFRRTYSDPSLAHVTGYASFTYGAAGIEGAYGESLVGQDAADPLARMRARYLGEAVPADSVMLTIDAAIQAAAAQALAGRRGAIVALDPRNGAILASVSFPTYEPALLADPATEHDAWLQLQEDPQRPLINRATQGLYPPGSTFKVVTAAAALENGVDPRTRIRVDDPFQGDPSWGSYAVRSVTRAHGEFDMARALQQSENIYFAKLALQIGPTVLAEYARRFGVGRAPALDLSAAPGQLSNSATLDRPTLLVDTAFGQGELLVSPLQMALVAATIANGGVMPTPHYAQSVRDAAGGVIRTIQPAAAGQVIRAETARTLNELMVGAVGAPGAFAAPAGVPGVAVAGKTGTAEVPSGNPHGWFVGFAPAAAPTIALAVVLENAPRGGEDAAPVASAVFRAALGR